MAIFPLEKAAEGARRERVDETLSGPVVELVAVRSPPRRDTGRPILHPTAGHAGVRSRGQALADGYQCASESDKCAMEISWGVFDFLASEAWPTSQALASHGLGQPV